MGRARIGLVAVLPRVDKKDRTGTALPKAQYMLFIASREMFVTDVDVDESGGCNKVPYINT